MVSGKYRLSLMFLKVLWTCKVINPSMWQLGTTTCSWETLKVSRWSVWVDSDCKYTLKKIHNKIKINSIQRHLTLKYHPEFWMLDSHYQKRSHDTTEAITKPREVWRTRTIWLFGWPYFLAKKRKASKPVGLVVKNETTELKNRCIICFSATENFHCNHKFGLLVPQKPRPII